MTDYTQLDRAYPVDPGYDSHPATRYIYAFLTEDRRNVKIGLVHSASALLRRLRDISRLRELRGLREVAHVELHHVDGHVAELIEAAIGLELIRNGLLRPAYRVDWYEVVGDVADTKWPELLEDARRSVWHGSSAEPTKSSTRTGTHIPTEQWTLERWEGAADPPDLPKIWSVKRRFVVDGHRSCAELAVLARLRDDGWDGVWVSAFGRVLRRDWFVTEAYRTIAAAGAPDDAVEVFERLRIANGGSLAGFFDVFAWRDGEVKFVEVKVGADRLQDSQLRFVDLALRLGHDLDEFLLVGVA